MKYQLPAGSKIKLLALRVNDLDAMIDFYTQIIGLISVKRTEDIAYLGVSQHHVSLTLRKVADVDASPEHHFTDQFAFQLPTSESLKQLLLHVKNLGVKLTKIQYNHNFEWIELKDPEGNQVVLYAFINGEIAVDDHSIQWHHEADDAIPLARFLSDEERRLKHLPEATELVWIKLMVSDLEQALAFYQHALGMVVLPTDRVDTKTLVFPSDHSQQLVLVATPNVATSGLGIDYISFKMIRSSDVDALSQQLSANHVDLYYDQIDHLLFVTGPDQIHLTFSVW